MNAPQPNQYDPANARALCACAAETYSPGLPSSAAPGDGWSASVVVETAHLRVVVWENESDLILAFRGTANLANAIADMDAVLHPENGWRVHEGFARSVDAVSTAVCGAFTHAIHCGGKRIWLTGHSLGGAMAHLCAAEFSRLRGDQPFAGIYTFGQPRVGDASYHNWFNFSGLGTITFRVVNQDDIVPRLPWVLGRFRHAGHEIYFTSPGRYFTDLSITAKLVADIPGLIREIYCDRTAFLNDHHVARYLDLFDSIKTKGDGAGNGTVIPPSAVPDAKDFADAPAMPNRPKPWAFAPSPPVETLSSVQHEIVREIYLAVQKLGGDPQLTSAINSWGDTLPEEDILDLLRQWNTPQPSVNKTIPSQS